MCERYIHLEGVSSMSIECAAILLLNELSAIGGVRSQLPEYHVNNHKFKNLNSFISLL